MRTRVFLILLVAYSIYFPTSLALAAQNSSIDPFADAATLRFLKDARQTEVFKEASAEDQNSVNCALECCDAFLKFNDGYDAEALNLIQKSKHSYPGLALLAIVRVACFSG
jgi:hypothetical protein